MGNIISRKQAAGQIRKTLESFYMLSRSVPGEGATGENDTPELERFFILSERLCENIQKKEYDTVLDSLDAESFLAFYHTVGILAEAITFIMPNISRRTSLQESQEMSVIQMVIYTITRGTVRLNITTRIK